MSDSAYSDALKQMSKGQLRLQIARGSQEEVYPAFEELMRRNMEEEQESTSLVEITLKDAERWRKLHREDPDATIDIYEEFDGAVEELNFLRDQLEEIKGKFEEYDQPPLCMSRILVIKKIREILKIEFERSDSSLISRHIALRERVKEAKLQADAPLWFLNALESLLKGPIFECRDEVGRFP